MPKCMSGLGTGKCQGNRVQLCSSMSKCPGSCPDGKCYGKCGRCSYQTKCPYNSFKVNNVNVDKFNFAMHRQCPQVSVRISDNKGFWDATGNYNKN